MKLKEIKWVNHRHGSGMTGFIENARVCEIDYHNGRYRVTAFGPNFQKMGWTDERQKAQDQAPAFVEKVLLSLFDV